MLLDRILWILTTLIIPGKLRVIRLFQVNLVLTLVCDRLSPSHGIPTRSRTIDDLVIFLRHTRFQMVSGDRKSVGPWNFPGMI